MDTNSIENIISLSQDLRWKIGDDFHDNLTEGIYADASDIAGGVVLSGGKVKRLRLDSQIGSLLFDPPSGLLRPRPGRSWH